MRYLCWICSLPSDDMDEDFETAIHPGVCTTRAWEHFWNANMEDHSPLGHLNCGICKFYMER